MGWGGDDHTQQGTASPGATKRTSKNSVQMSLGTYQFGISGQMTNHPRMPLPQASGEMLHNKELPKGKLLEVSQQIVLKLSKLFLKLSTEAHSWGSD